MLKAVGERPYLLTHGTDRDSYCMILVSVTEAELAALKTKTGADPEKIAVGKFMLAVLPLEDKAAAGTVDKRYYDPEKKRWTSTIALSRYK